MSTSSYKWKAAHCSYLFIVCFSLIIWIVLGRWLIIFLTCQDTLGNLYILGILIVNPCFARMIIKLNGRDWVLRNFWVFSCLRSCIDEGICGHRVANRELNLLESLHSFGCREVDCGTYSLILLINWILVRMLVMIDKSLGRYRPYTKGHFIISWLSKHFVRLSCSCLTLLC